MRLPEPAPPATPLLPIRGRALGVDPGLNVTGYAVLEPGRTGAPVVLEAGVIRGGPAATPLPQRLETLFLGVLEVLDAFRPAALALEQVHSHTKHPRTALLMAHARGVIVLAAARRGVPVAGYAPSRIKKCLTGSGKAPKAQVQHAIRAELRLDRLPEPSDVADACAVALCHLQIEANRQGLAPR